MRSLRATLAVVALWSVKPAALAQAQNGADSVLFRPITFEVRNASLGEALARLRHEQQVPLAYSGDLLPAHHRVSLAVKAEPLGTALARLLQGSGLGVAVTRQGTVVIVRAPLPGALEASRELSLPAERLELATGVRQLDEIVVMGSAVSGAPEREQPTALSVVSGAGLAEAPHTRVSDLVRTLLPGVVLWDRGPTGPPAQVTSVRGVSSFTTRSLKTYVDGVELASPDLFTLIDGRSIERIEVIRGPQGAALYGPDALNGILQIVTRKGQPGGPAIQGRGAVSGGPFERADLEAPLLWQDHSLGVTGAGNRASFDVGGTYAHAGSSGAVSSLNTWTANAGGKAVLGSVLLTTSARAGRYEYGAEHQLGGGITSATSAPQDIRERGVGLTAVHSLTPWWRQTLIAGHHWISGPREPLRPALLTPLLPLGATHETAERTSIRYSSAWDIGIGDHGATLSAGVEHSRRAVERAIRQAVTARDLSPLYDEDLHATGGFGQARIRFGTHLVVSGGARSEWISSVGADRGASWASTAGASWTHSLGHSTLRLRTAWGRGLRAPEPGMSRELATATIRQAPNPDLAPETQNGIELGAELHFGERAWAQVTWYHQRAEDLIQQVALPSDGSAVRAFQFQNVGAIANRGVELEGGVRSGRVAVTALVYLVRSEVERLARRYTGELRPGDAMLEVPEGVGSVSVRYDAGRVGLEAGATWLGPWIGYDRAALLGTDEGQAPARASLREYWISYPGVVRPWLAGSVELGGRWSAFLRVDNPGKQPSVIRDNVTPPLGRTSLVGLELRP